MEKFNQEIYDFFPIYFHTFKKQKRFLKLDISGNLILLCALHIYLQLLIKIEFYLWSLAEICTRSALLLRKSKDFANPNLEECFQFHK